MSSSDSPAARLLALTEVSITFDQMREQMVNNMRGQFPHTDFLDQYLTALNTALGEVFTFEGFAPEAIAAFEQTFSDDEINEMIKFFESPVGRRWVKVYPEFSAKLQADITASVQARMPMVLEITDRLMSASQ